MESLQNVVGELSQENADIKFPLSRKGLSTYVSRQRDSEIDNRLGSEEVHFCHNGCTLYRGEYLHHLRCPKCHRRRYKDEGNNRPECRMFYYPLVGTIRRLYSNRINQNIENLLENEIIEL